MNKLIGFAIPVLILLGMKMYNKSDASSDVQEELIEICEMDETCENAVNSHFKKCFEQNYTMGSRRRGGRLDTNNLLGCINSRSGELIFTIEKPEG